MSAFSNNFNDSTIQRFNDPTIPPTAMTEETNMKAQSTSIHAPCSMLNAQSRKVRSGRRWTAAAAAWILAAGTLLGGAGVAKAFPSWMGIFGSYTTYSGRDKGTFTIAMNQDYSGLHAEVGINDGSWGTHSMSYIKHDDGNSIWQYTPSSAFPPGTTVEYYFHGWDDWNNGNIYAYNNPNASFTTAPTAPTITVNSSDSTSIKFTVNANGNGSATTYKYYFGTSSSGTPDTACTAGTAVTKSSLTPGTTYYIKATATAGGSSATSGNTTRTTSPKAPTITSVSAPSSTSVKFTVNANGNGSAATYKYIVGTSSGTPTEACTAGTAVTVSSLSPGTTYTITAMATAGGNNSSTVTETVTTLPTAPSVSVVARSTDYITILAATGVNGAATTHTYGYGTSNPATPSASITPGTNKKTSSLTPGTLYYFTVRASAGGSTADTTISATTKPVAPTITDVAYDATSVTFKVNPNGNGDNTAYHYTVTTSSSHTASTDCTTAVNNNTTITKTGLTTGTAYYIHVRARAKTSTSDTGWDTYGPFTPTAAAREPTVASPTAANIAPTTATLGATVTSDGNDTITEYGVVVSTSAAPTTSATLKFNTTGAPTTGTPFTFSATGLSAGTTYHYRGYAINGVGTSYTPDATFSTPTAVGLADDEYDYTGSALTLVGNGGTVGGSSVGGAFSYSVQSGGTGAGTISGDKLTVTACGTIKVRVTKAADAPYAEQYTDVMVTVNGVTPTLSSPTATGFSSSGATLGATLGAIGSPNISTLGVQYGKTTSYGSTANVASPAAGAYTKAVTGLSADTVYHYRGYGVNDAGKTGYTADATFRTTASAPGAPTALAVTQPGGVNTLHVSWSAASGSAGTMVVMYTSDPTTAPTARKTYTGNAAYGSASTLGSGKIVYVGSGTSVDVTGLAAGTRYYVRAYAYKGTANATAALNSLAYSSAATANGYTLASEPSASPTLSVNSRTDSTIKLNLTRASGAGYTLIVAYQSESAPSYTAPTDGTTYTANLDFTSASSSSLGAGKVVYASTGGASGTTVTVSGLTPGTHYYFAAYAYNGATGRENYRATATTCDGYTFSTEPAAAPEIAITANATGTLTLSITRASGSGYTLIQANAANSFTAPADGTGYTANARYGSGTRIDSKGYVVYAGSDASTTLEVTGLSAGTRYYFRAYSFNGSGGAANYYTTAYGSANGYTLANPVTVASATADGKTMVRLSWTKPSGASGVMVVDNGTTAPTQGSTYTVGSTTLGGHVIYRSTGTSLEHVVASGSTHTYKIYAYSSANAYSAVLEKPVTTGSFGAEEIVDTFSYTNGVSLNGLNGEHGWSGAWDTGATTAPTIVSQSGSDIPVFPNYTEYPDNTGNRIKTSLGEANWQTEATRDFTAVSSGAIYAAAILSYQYEGAKKWAQIGLGNGSGVAIKAGHIWSSSADYHLGIDAYDHKEYSGSFEINPYQWDTDNEYLVILKYEFSTGKISVKGYYHGAAVPEGEPAANLWDVTYTVPSGSRPGSLSRFGLLAGATDGGAVGDVYFDEVRVATSWEALLGGTVAVPENIAELTAAADGKELVRVRALAPANARQIVFIAKSGGTLTTLSTTEQTLKSRAPGATAGNAEVIAVLDATAGSYCTADHVVATGSQHGYFAYAKNSTEYSPSYTAATGNPVETGSYDASEYLDTFSYTNGTTEASSGNSWKGGQGWGANWWHTDAGTWTAVRPTEIASTVNIAGTIANSTAVGNAVKLTNPGEGGAGTLERTTGGDAWGGGYNNTFYVAFRMAYSWNDPNRWAGLKLIDTTDGSKGVFIGRTMKDDTGASVKHSKLGIEAATSSGGTPSVGSAASGTLYALNDTGGANNAYLVVARVKWTSTAHATVDAWSYKVEGGTPLPTTEPSGNGMAHWEGAYLANVRVIQLQAGSIGTDQIGDVYFDEVRFGSKWEDLLGGVPPEFVWLDGQTTTAYRGDWVTNAVKSRPVGDRQSAQSLLTSSDSPAASAFSAAVGATYFGREEGDTVTVWHGLHQITSVTTPPLYGFGAVSGGGTAVYSMDHSDTAQRKHTYNLSVLPKPAAFSAESGGATKINLTWTPATAGGRTFDEVMVVRFATAGASTQTEAHLHPAQGTAYTVGDTFKYGSYTATVIYRGTGTGFTDTRLTPETTYYYAAYTVNNSYYSEPPSGGGAGRLNANATTAEGSSGTMPEVNGDGSDWTGAPAVAWNSSDTSDNEFVWNDKKGDLRSNTDDCYSADIDEFRVKADGEWVYFLLRLNGNVPAGKSVDLHKTYVSVGVDTRLSEGSTAMNWLGDESATELGGAYHGTAAERYASRQMAVHYVGGSENTWQVEMYAEDGARWYEPPTEGWQAAAAGTTDPCVEWRVSRADLGLGASGTAVTTGRFSVATFVNAQGWNQDTKATVDIDPGKSAAVDAMEIAPYGVNDKDANLGAWDEGLKDKTVNFWADVGFDKDGVVPNGLPNEPGFSGADTGHGSPTLNWTASTDTDAKGFVTGYLFELAEDSATLNGRDGGTENGSVLYRINLKGADNTSYRPQTTAAQFWWRVRARDNGGQLSAGTIRRYSVEGQKDMDGPKPELLYVGTQVADFLANTPDPETGIGYRDEVEAEGDALAVVDSVYSEGSKPTFGFVLQWSDDAGVYATNRSWDSSYTKTTRYDARVSQGLGTDGYTLGGGAGAFTWNILGEKGDGSPFGRVSPNWDLMLVDTKHTATFTGPSGWSTSGGYVWKRGASYKKTADTSVAAGKDYYTESGGTYTKVANPSGKNPSAEGWYEFLGWTYTKLSASESGLTSYYKMASGAEPNLQETGIHWVYEAHLELPTEEDPDKKIVTEGWTHVYDKDLPFLPSQTLWDTTATPNANLATCITNFVSQAFKLPAYDPDVSLYLTVSAEDGNTYGNGNTVPDGWIDNWYDDTPEGGVSHAHYSADTAESSGSCNDGPAYARNITTNRLILIPVRDDDSAGPEAATTAWAGANDGEPFAPSLVIATQAVTKAQAASWSAMYTNQKLLPRLDGTGQGVTYQLTDAMLGAPLTFLFNVYDQHITSGLKYGTAASESVKTWTWTNTAFRTRSWNSTGYPYSAVVSPGAANPKEQGWYVLAGGKYVPAEDTSVQAGTTYYTRSEDGWVTSEENVDKFNSDKSTIKYYKDDTKLHGPGTGDGTILAWEFGELTEASLGHLFGVPNVLDYIGHHSDGVTNLVQLHAWDCDNDRTGDQTEAEITFGTLMLTDDDATEPTSPGYALLGSGTNYVDFGALASWEWSTSGKPASWSTNTGLKGIDATEMSAWSVGSSGDTAITGDSVKWTERASSVPEGQDWSAMSRRYMSLEGGMQGATYQTAGGAKYFQFDVCGENGARWTADTLQFDNRVTAKGPTLYTLTVQEAANVTTLAAVTADGQKDPAWNVSGGLFEKANGILRFTLESTGGTASLASPSFQPNSNGRAMTRVQYRVGRIGGVKDGATLTVGYRIGSGTRTVVKTHASADFAESAANKFANYEVVSFDLPTDQAGDFTVTWEASGINGSQGFLLTDVSVVMQNSFNTEHPLVQDLLVEKAVDSSTDGSQETIKNVVMSWAGTENAEGTTWRYRLYAYGADGTGNWGINKIKLLGITMSPRGMDVTDGDLRHATWVNSLEVVDGEKSGWDTEKSGLWLKGDNAPAYVISYPEADAAGRAGTAVASGTFAYKDGKIRKAAYSVLPDGTFEADPTAWTLSGATIGTGSGTRERVLKLAGEDSAVSSATKGFDVSLGSIAAADVSGVTVSGGFEAKASVAEGSGGVNGLTVTVRLKDAGGNVLLAKTFEYAPVAAWRQLEIGPWTADNALVRKAEAEIAQTTAEGTELLVANVALQLATWGAPTGDFDNGEPGAKLELQTQEVAAGKTLKLSSELTGEGSKEYVLASTVHDYDRDRTDDALAVTIATGFELHDDDTQAPSLGAKFGGPVGMRLGNRSGLPYNASGTDVQVVVTDHQMDAAKRDGQSLAYLDIDGYDQSGWTTAALTLNYTEGGSAKSLAYDGADVTEGAAGLPSATNTFHYSLSTLWANTFVKNQFAAYTANMTVNATLTDQDDDRADDSLDTVSQLGFLKFMDNDTTAPAMRTSGSLKGMFIATNPPSGSIETALSGVSNKDWSAKSEYEVLTLTASDTASERLQLIYDGELCRSAPFYLMANVGDALQSGTGVSISGLQRGNAVSKSIQNGFNDTIAVSNTTMVLSNSATIVTNLATHFNEGYSSAFKTTRGGTAAAPQTWYWPTGMTTNEVGFLLPPESTSLDFRVLVEAFDSDTNRPSDQAHARLEGPTLRIRDDDTTAPQAPASVWLNGDAVASGEITRDNAPWKQSLSSVTVAWTEAVDPEPAGFGTAGNDIKVAGIAGYRLVAPGTTPGVAEGTDLTGTTTNTAEHKVTKTLTGLAIDQGFGNYQLFAVDKDADRAGDALAGAAANVPLALDFTKPTAVALPGGHGAGASTDAVDDPTTQMDITWTPSGVGPDDPTGDKTNYDKIPDAVKADAKAKGRAATDILSPWRTYKVYYREYDPQAVEAQAASEEMSAAQIILRDYVEADTFGSEAAGWLAVTNDAPIADPSTTQRKYSGLDEVSTPSVRVYDLDFDREYLFVVVGVDKAGNEGPVNDSSWATNNTIKFAVTQGLVRASADIAADIPASGDTGMKPINPQAKRGAALYWMAAGQKDGVGKVSKEYDLIYRDAPSFTEEGDEGWNLVGTVKTNWNYQTDGLDTVNDNLRFFRASYKGRWQGEKPLASEEVYSMNNVVLSEGFNYVSLQGVPYTNTFAGVFGTDTDMWPPNADSPASTNGAVVIEFYTAGDADHVRGSTKEQYFFASDGKWWKCENNAAVEDVTTKVLADHFFMRPFSINLPSGKKADGTDLPWWTEHNDPSITATKGTNRLNAILWHPILQVPPTNEVVAVASASTSSAKPGGRDGTASGALVFRQSVTATKGVYNTLSLNLPVSVHPKQLRLVATNAAGVPQPGRMKAGNWVDADKLYVIDTATKEIREKSTMYCDAEGTWRYNKNRLEVTGTPIHPNDMLVLISAGGNGEKGATVDWVWTYSPTDFYKPPTRHMGR